MLIENPIQSDFTRRPESGQRARRLECVILHGKGIFRAKQSQHNTCEHVNMQAYQDHLQKIKENIIQACEGPAYAAMKKPWYLWLVTKASEEIQKLTKRRAGSRSSRYQSSRHGI